MRRLAFLAIVIGTAAAIIIFAAIGTLNPATLNPSRSAAAVRARVTGSLRSAIGGQLAEGEAKAAGGTPVSHRSTDHPGGITVYRNVTYGSVAGQSLLLDAYIPDGGPHPAVVVIHGGGWAYGNKHELDFEGENLAAGGFAAFVVDYRMAPPGGTWHAPVALEDVRAAVVWVRHNAATYHVNPRAVGALGNSAGGNLAMMLGTTGSAGVDRVEAAVSYSGQSDLRRLSNAHTIHAATNYIGCSATECPDKWIANSPVDHCSSATAPMLIVNSTHELMPLDQATVMDARLSEVGVPHELRVLEGDQHASAYAGEVWPQTLAFLRTHLGG